MTYPFMCYGNNKARLKFSHHLYSLQCMLVVRSVAGGKRISYHTLLKLTALACLT